MVDIAHEATVGLGSPFQVEADYDIRTRSIVSVSVSTHTMVGYDLTFLMGRSMEQLFSLLAADDQRILGPILVEVRDFIDRLPPASMASAHVTCCIHFTAPGIENKWLRLSARPKPDAAGFIRFYHVVMQDVTGEYTGNNMYALISFLDPFGRPGYRRFQQVAPALSELNPREQKLLKMLAQGLTSKEIAAVLQVSKDTIDKSRKLMLSKTGAKNTVELIAFIRENQAL